MNKITFLKVRKVLQFIIFSFFFLLLAVFFRPTKQKKKIFGFGADQFTGDIKYLYDEMRKHPKLRVYFVTGDKNEIDQLRMRDIDSRYYMDIKSIPLFLRTHAWITSHGYNYIPFFGLLLRVLPFYKGKHGSKWVDVWHGLGFKDAGREEVSKNYDLICVTSSFFSKYYSKKDPQITNKIKITGSPRNDPLLDGRWSPIKIAWDFKIPPARKNILYAPTWQVKGIFHWEPSTKFLENMEKFCKENSCNFLIRMHPLWYRQNINRKTLLETQIKHAQHIFHITPYKYVDTQPLLFISDVLITGWSSIANDFILLNRPMIFLDIPFPVERFVLTPEDRVGYVVKNKNEFYEKLHESITQPNLFEKKRGTTMKKLYTHLDGNSSKRCLEEIFKMFET